MMFRQIVIFIVMASCLVWANRAHTQLDQSPASKVEIYVNGQKFSSLLDYKRSSLRDTLKEKISNYPGSDWDQFVQNVLANLPGEYFNDFGKDEIISMMNGLRTQMLPKSKTVKRSQELNEMEEMLEDYIENHEDLEDLEFDPENIKTIIISPEEELESEVLVDDLFDDDVIEELEPSQEEDATLIESDDYDDEDYEMEDDDA